MNERKREGRVFVLLALLGLGGTTLLTGCGGDDSKPKDPPPPAAPPKPNAAPMGN